MATNNATHRAIRAAHNRIKQLFRRFEIPANSSYPKDSAALADEICTTVLGQLNFEQEIIFPEVRNLLEDQRAFERLSVQHSQMRYFTKRIEAMTPAHSLFEATVNFLGDCMTDYIRELEAHILKELRHAAFESPQSTVATDAPVAKSLTAPVCSPSMFNDRIQG